MPSPLQIVIEAVIGIGLFVLLWIWVPRAIGREEPNPWKGMHE